MIHIDQVYIYYYIAFGMNYNPAVQVTIMSIVFQNIKLHSSNEYSYYFQS